MKSSYILICFLIFPCLQSKTLNKIGLNDVDRRILLHLVLTSRIASRRQDDPFSALSNLGFTPTSPPIQQTNHADGSRGKVILKKGNTSHEVNLQRQQQTILRMPVAATRLQRRVI